LKVPADAAPGAAPLAVSMRGGAAGPCTASLGNIQVGAVDRAFSPPTVDVPVPAAAGTLSGTVRLFGSNLSPGSPATLTLVWQALAPMDKDYTVFVHVYDEGTGQLAAQADNEPRGGTYATTLWQAGEVVTDEYHFTLPPGRYSAQVGLYL